MDDPFKTGDTPERNRATPGQRSHNLLLVKHLSSDSWAAPWVIAVVVFLVLGGVSFWLSRAEVAEQRADVRGDAELVALAAADRFQGVVFDALRPLRRVVRNLGSSAISDPNQFKRAATTCQGRFPVLVWVDHEGMVKAVLSKQPDQPVMGQSITSFPMWKEVWGKSRQPYRDSVVAGELGGEPAQWLCMPYTTSERDGQPRERGAVLALAHFGRLASEPFADGPWKSWGIDIRDETGRAVHAADPAKHVTALAARAPVQVLWSDWTVEVYPEEGFVAARLGIAPRVILGCGLAAALLGGLGTWQTLTHRRREQARISVHLAALEALARMSQNITENPGDSDAPLVQLADVAARLMDMPMRIVALVDREARCLRTIHREGVPIFDDRNVYPLSETPLSQRSMSTGQPLLLGDVEMDPPASLRLLRPYGIRSFIVLPLLVTGEALGVIILGSARPRRFTSLDHHLADLWVAQATALLSNRRLYERMEQAVSSLRRLLEQRDTLYQVNSMIQHASSLREALDRLAELAPRALDVDAAVVVLAHCEPAKIQIAAVTRTDPPNTMPVDATVECPTCASVIGSGQIRIVEDTSQHPIRGFPDMGSALFVPLRGSGVTNGLLVLLRRQKGPFAPEQVQTAELFAARAAAATESARFHEQTRRHAETNAILLRELNHRVGNNLASIVGLLTMAANRLPQRSRPLLERAIERVAMMARAHELFSGGVQNVQLGELLRTTLASVSPVHGPDTRIGIEIQTGEISLPATRGITLAMVLHELAYNAVVHALAAEGGELIVRARPIAEHRIAIDVIDRAAVAVSPGSFEQEDFDLDLTAMREARSNPDGTGNGHEHPGIGLQLVRNLVTRELRGNFTLQRSPDGGTIATVELAVNEDNS